MFQSWGSLRELLLPFIRRLSRLKVHFDPVVARYVKESKWHPSQVLTPQKGGVLIAEFDLSNYEEIKRWILSFGKHAAVIDPAELRSEVEEELTEMLEGYSKLASERRVPTK